MAGISRSLRPEALRRGLGQTMPPADLAAVVRYIGEHRDDGSCRWLLRWKAGPTARRLTAAGGTSAPTATPP